MAAIGAAVPFLFHTLRHFGVQKPAVQCHTVTDNHASLQRFVSEGFVADAAGPFVDVEEAAHTMTRTVKVVQSCLPQSRTGKRIQEVAWKENQVLQQKD